MKKLLLMLLTATLIFAAVLMTNTDVNSIIPEAYAAEIIESGTCGDNITWELDNDGTLIVSGSGAMTNYTVDDFTPWRFVTIKKVIVRDGVTTIGDYAFSSCFDLVEVELPDSLLSIGELAFYNCDLLTDVYLPEGLTVIGERAFDLCDSLTAINVHENNSSYSSVLYLISD